MVSEEINKFIEDNGGNTRDALNIALARLWLAERKVHTSLQELSLLQELDSLESRGIYITADLVGLGSDEWKWQFIIYRLSDEEMRLKRRTVKLIESRCESFSEGFGTYVGAWDTGEDAIREGIKQIKRTFK